MNGKKKTNHLAVSIIVCVCKREREGGGEREREAEEERVKKILQMAERRDKQGDHVSFTSSCEARYLLLYLWNESAALVYLHLFSV